MATWYAPSAGNPQSTNDHKRHGSENYRKARDEHHELIKNDKLVTKVLANRTSFWIFGIATSGRAPVSAPTINVICLGAIIYVTIANQDMDIG